jgi:hypothetical protein
MDSFDARTWPAAYLEWWFGDGAPNLDRDKLMLFEEVARMLLNREELEYHLACDEERYEASAQCRFDTPEILSVLFDVVRRLAMLRGARATVNRKGFDGDLKALATATLEDFMVACSIAQPGESIKSAAARKDMPSSVRTAMRSLLLSTANLLVRKDGKMLCATTAMRITYASVHRVSSLR